MGDRTYTAFLSFAAEDRSVMVRLREKIMRELPKVHGWMDDREIRAGQELSEVISKAIETCDLFVVLVTPRFNESPWFKKELALALKRENQLKEDGKREEGDPFIVPVVYHFEPKNLPEGLAERLAIPLYDDTDPQMDSAVSKIAKSVVDYASSVIPVVHTLTPEQLLEIQNARTPVFQLARRLILGPEAGAGWPLSDSERETYQRELPVGLRTEIGKHIGQRIQDKDKRSNLLRLIEEVTQWRDGADKWS